MTASLFRFSLFALLIFFCALTAVASEIREFDLKTLQRLGNELTRVSQTPDRGATTPERKRAKQTAMSALKGKLYDIHYDYVVLDDPDGSGLLVYALGKTSNPGDVVLAGHFRVTVSADGATAERVDALSRSLAIQHAGEGLPAGSHLVGMSMAQIVSSKPLETLVYTSNLTKMPIYVATAPHGKIWEVATGKITDTGETAGKNRK
jgi:hypothetical protein